MIIYQITQIDTRRGSIRHWAKSKTDISSIKAKVRAAYRTHSTQKNFVGWGGPFKHEIDKGKDGVVEFLNRHARLDNG
jgi:hypothetical protein